MARVEIKEFRPQHAHFGFYRTSAGGDQDIFIRRKVGEPTDYMHSKSVRVKDQRNRLATASRHYASLTPVQKARLRPQMRFVSRVGSGSVSEEVLLQGRQLFISEDIRELKTKQKLLSPLFEVCIVLCDMEYTALSGKLWLYYWIAGEWREIPGQELAIGNWLFSRVPPGQAAYRVYGEADGFFDPEYPEFQSMSEERLKAHHGHVLLPGTARGHLYTTSSFRHVGIGFVTPFRVTAVRTKTRIYWGNLEGIVEHCIMKSDWTKDVEGSYYISSVEGQWTERSDYWTGLNLEEGARRLYTTDRPGPRYHYVIYEYWYWLHP
ncbi:hypothetical protein ES708_28599 [subsurface metagenome]